MTTYHPDARLTNFVDCFWTVPRSIGSVLQSQEIMTPGTSIELIFNPDTIQKIFLIRGSVFMGRKNCCTIEEIDPHPIFGITFKINGLSPFSKLSFKDFTISALQRPCFQQSVIEPADVLGKVLLELADKLTEAANIAKKIKLANEFFLLKLKGIRPVDHFTDYLIREFYRNKGMMNIGQLGKKYKVSKKTVERRFVNATGLNPKIFNRIIRFNHILKCCFNGNSKEIEEMIYNLGYYDRSHFQMDFKSFTKLTPAVFMAKDYRILQGLDR